jgi:hypothetical protein
MAQEWHYAKNGERHGPVTTKQLKELADSGDLQPSDLVWTEGRDEWKPASVVKGLFSGKTSRTAPPPSLPGKTPPPVSAPSIADAAPALWNPKALGICSLFFTWGFGAFLLARNWKALGDENRAKKAMYWFYSAIGFLGLALVTPDSPSINLAFRGIGLAILAAWSLIEAQSQIKFVKDNFDNDYHHKAWGKPIGIVVALIFGIAVLVTVASVGQGGGSITFAEEVDYVTFELTNEGTEFTTGEVNMVIRGNSSFGDSRLIVSYRMDGEAAWRQLLDEDCTVDPAWDVVSLPIHLVDPGNYEISVKTSSGTLIAQNYVTIVTAE